MAENEINRGENIICITPGTIGGKKEGKKRQRAMKNRIADLKRAAPNAYWQTQTDRVTPLSNREKKNQ